MLWNSLMKKPALIMGIIMMTLFILDYRSKKEGNKSIFFRDAFTSWACKPVVQMLKKSSPNNWKYNCKEENLKIIIEVNYKVSKAKELQLLYRELANNLMYISKNSPEENLERVLVIHTQLIATHYRVDAVTEGKDLAKMKFLKDDRFIKQHLQATVKVKETAL